MVSQRNLFRFLSGASVALVMCTALAACSGSDPGSTPAAGPAPATSSAPTPTTSSPTTSSPTPTCATLDLKVALDPTPGGGTAGATHAEVTFTNTTDAPCAMTGWPGVSFVGGGDGSQIGAAADRTGSATVITLAPGAVAAADLTESDPGAHGCSTSTDGLRVYPPNNRAAVFVKHPGQACSDTSEHLLTVAPVHLR